jgi:uncharacterized repeat protein (TIGR03806 family)
MRKLITLVIVIGISISCSPNEEKKAIKEVSLSGNSKKSKWPDKLSDWELFNQPIARLSPVKGVFIYDINSPLFSDYAHKSRFIKLPQDSVIQYNTQETFDFPIGTILIKNFYYPSDFSQPEGERNILETRLLVNNEAGWEAVPYVWNEVQTEANLEVAGATKQVSWKDTKGIVIDLDYSVPNQVQCKNCHERNGKFSPIGPSARQLNKDGQLQHWQTQGWLSGLPSSDIPKLVNYNDQEAMLNKRARAWLEINCAHCHSNEGPAKNTGLYLHASETDKYRLGFNKPPVAAGKGSGGLRYDIVAGKPDESILLYRIQSTDPGIMMPELGRKMVHQEGVELVREWILSL